jgi:hypothetical protein
MIDTLQALIMELEQDSSLDQPERLRERAVAMDRLESQLIYAPDHDDMDSTQAPLYRRASELHARMEAINHALCQSIGNAIRRGDGAKALRAWAPSPQANTGANLDGDSYDHLDTLLSDVLNFDLPDAEIAALPPDMVFYQPTPARHIFDLIERAAINDADVVMDLGSGLGHVPMLVSICTGARCIGIEREPVYVDAAKRSAQSLNLHEVSFIAQDVRDADLSPGTVFYLYTPFTGGILRDVLDRLKHEAANREIRIVTLGPCTAMVALESWLRVVGTQDGSHITLFQPLSGTLAT